jgi:hypothetical protein
MGKITPYKAAKNATVKIEQFDTTTNYWFVSVEVEEGHDVCVALLDKYTLLKAIQDSMDMKDLDLYIQAIHNVGEEE